MRLRVAKMKLLMTMMRLKRMITRIMVKILVNIIRIMIINLGLNVENANKEDTTQMRVVVTSKQLILLKLSILIQMKLS